MPEDKYRRLQQPIERARQLLEREYGDQLAGLYNILPSGEILDDAPGDPTIRSRLLEVIAHYRSGGAPEKEAVERARREMAFTTLNRFVALKMAERRGLVRECISQGLQSDGIRELAECAPGLRAACADGGYRLLLEAVMDEISLGLKVLFDRRSPTGLLWPSPKALAQLLDILNAPELAQLWEEDETIGWVYQYFNADDVREMREASPAPRNSRELAVRNQFFTPRYVVEFLTDNTLGRIWYEMRNGQTALRERCRMLVYRPNEVSLNPGEKPPVDAGHNEALSQDGRNRPLYVPHRPKKDPRDLKMLAPACGSAHFLLYGFDLLETIYEEAWADEDSPPSEVTGKTLRDQYPDLEMLRRNLPALILSHNLYGIEIDVRAAQIAALALWLRAQRAYQKLGIEPAGRPTIERSNIVVAEPMPGERELLAEFVETLQPKLLGQLVRRVFEKMTLAGEAGSLLKVEDELRNDIAEAKKLWLASSEQEQIALFPEERKRKAEQMTLFDLSGITDEQFWAEAERRVLDALRQYAARATNGKGFARKLFADDAEQGFAFVDLCQKHFDVVLMNPPFGDASRRSLQVLDDQLASSGRDIGAAFVAAASDRWAPNGYVGVLLTTRSWFQPAYSSWREANLLDELRGLSVAAHLGGDVLDGATVNASAFVTKPHRQPRPVVTFFRMIRAKEKASDLESRIQLLRNGQPVQSTYLVALAALCRLDGSPLTYWISDALRNRIASLPKLEGTGGTVKQGTATADEFRFTRAWWEITADRKWLSFTKSSEYSPYWDDPTWVFNFANDGDELRASGRAVLRGMQYYGKPGTTFPSRAVLGFNARAHPSGCAFSHTGAVAFANDASPAALLGYLVSRPVEYVLSFFVGSLQGEAGFHPNHYEVGVVARAPWPQFLVEDLRQIAESAIAATRLAMSLFLTDETSHHFVRPCALEATTLADAAAEHRKHEATIVRRIAEVRRSTDHLVATALGFSAQDLEDMELEFAARTAPAAGRWRPYFGVAADAPDAKEVAASLVSYAVGCGFGRWDVRVAMGQQPVPELPDPFVPIEVCPPGMLTGDDKLPTCEAPPRYPLRVGWGGLLVNDPGFAGGAPVSLDVVGRVRQVLEAIWGERAGDIDRETCHALGVRELRDYIQRPGGFFQDHLRRYSKSRRKAPIYWPLSTASNSYTIWLYYPRLTQDMLYRVVTEHVEPKLAQVGQRIAQLEGEQRVAEGRPAARLAKELGEVAELQDELREMRDELLRVARLPYRPKLDDGVQICAAPLWRLFRYRPWRTELEKTWKDLESGKYDWAYVAYAIWPVRVREKCKTDLSLAIAHSLEELYEQEKKPQERRKRKKMPLSKIASLNSFDFAPGGGDSSGDKEGV